MRQFLIKCVTEIKRSPPKGTATKGLKAAMLPEDRDELERMLEQLKTEHRDLDVVIEQLSDSVPVDFLRLQRLKKRKLFLKDSILKIESMMLPDIIA